MPTPRHQKLRELSLRVCLVALVIAAFLQLVLTAWEFKGIDTGWTLYTPYSVNSSSDIEYELYRWFAVLTTIAWVLAALAGALNLSLVNGALRARSASSCPACNYDGTDAGGPNCPECGTHRTDRGAESRRPPP